MFTEILKTYISWRVGKIQEVCSTTTVDITNLQINPDCEGFLEKLYINIMEEICIAASSSYPLTERDFYKRIKEDKDPYCPKYLSDQMTEVELYKKVKESKNNFYSEFVINQNAFNKKQGKIRSFTQDKDYIKILVDHGPSPQRRIKKSMVSTVTNLTAIIFINFLKGIAHMLSAFYWENPSAPITMFTLKILLRLMPTDPAKPELIEKVLDGINIDMQQPTDCIKTRSTLSPTIDDFEQELEFYKPSPQKLPKGASYGFQPIDIKKRHLPLVPDVALQQDAFNINTDGVYNPLVQEEYLGFNSFGIL
uniref:Uncharacterized protein n=1 Tax=Abalone asfa-like virus TaxID=2839893 RepID=A0A5K7Y7S7_9VIRU|nr:hypothetical protein [Abalone asfa-like virus]BCY04546.1 hypothetical protein [Abalone asfa-like virus]